MDPLESLLVAAIDDMDRFNASNLSVTYTMGAKYKGYKVKFIVTKSGGKNE